MKKKKLLIYILIHLLKIFIKNFHFNIILNINEEFK